MAQHVSAQIQAKLDRIDEHFELLNDKFWAAIKEHTNHLFAPVEFDPQSGWYESNVGEFRPDTTQIAVIGGEINYQLRSILEHLAWALVKANHKKPIGNSRGTTFPIRATKPRDFVGETRRNGLRGVTVAAAQVIEQFQPYNTGNQSLLAIDHFAKVDRHQSLLVTAVNVTKPEQLRPLYTINPPGSLKGFHRVVKRGQRLVPGTKIARLLFHPGVKPQVYMNGALSLAVAVTDRRGGPDSDIEGDIVEVTRLFNALKPHLGS